MGLALLFCASEVFASDCAIFFRAFQSKNSVRSALPKRSDREPILLLIEAVRDRRFRELAAPTARALKTLREKSVEDYDLVFAQLRSLGLTEKALWLIEKDVGHLTDKNKNRVTMKELIFASLIVAGISASNIYLDAPQTRSKMYQELKSAHFDLNQVDDVAPSLMLFSNLQAAPEKLNLGNAVHANLISFDLGENETELVAEYRIEGMNSIDRLRVRVSYFFGRIDKAEFSFSKTSSFIHLTGEFNRK